MQVPLAIWVGIMPLVQNRGIYEGLKVLIFWIGSIVLIAYLLILRRKNFLKNLNKWDFFYFLWIFILTFSSFLSSDWVNGIVGGGYRHQGVIFFIGLWILGKTIQLLGPKFEELAFKILKISLIIECLVVVIQVVFKQDLVNLRPIGSFGEANAVAGFLSISPVLSGSVFLNTFSFICILLTQSRSGLLAYATLLLVLPKLSRQVKLSIVVFTLVAVFLLGSKRPFLGTYKFEDRFTYSRLAVSAILKKPIIGYGPESTSVVLEDGFDKTGINLEDLTVDRTHNIIIDILLWSGICGLICIGLYIYGNWSKDVSGLLIFSLLQPLGVVHWILIFLMLHLKRSNEKGTNNRNYRSGWFLLGRAFVKKRLQSVRHSQKNIT